MYNMYVLTGNDTHTCKMIIGIFPMVLCQIKTLNI